MTTNDDEDQNKVLFPSDMVMEILRRVRSPKLLIQLQLVCKEWKSIIRSPRFGEEYHNDSDLVDNYNVVPSSSVADHPEPSFRSMCSRYGLLLVRRNGDNKDFVWNPATCQVRDLPDPHKDSYGFAFTYVASGRNYMLLSVYKHESSGGEVCEVINLSHGASEWTHLLSFPDHVNGGVEQKMVQLVMSGEEVYCVRSFKVGMESYKEVVTIDIGNKSCTLTCVPKGSFPDWKNARALDWNGKLGFASIVGENLHLLVLEDYKRQKWSETVIPLPFIKKEKYNEGRLIPLFTENGCTRFWLKDEKTFTYNLCTGLITHVQSLYSNAVPNNYYPFKKSIIHLDGMQPADTAVRRLRYTFIKDW